MTGELFDLVAVRLACGQELCRVKDVPATAALRPVLDDLIDRARRQELSAVAFMAILGALPAP